MSKWAPVPANACGQTGRLASLSLSCALLLCLTSCSACDPKPDPVVTPNNPNGSDAKAVTPAPSTGSHYERKEAKERVIVFVHGVYGSAAGTWTCVATGVAWPKLLLSDPAFANTDIYVAEYPTHFTGNMMSIDDQVSNLTNRLEADEVFSKHGEVVFVAHSLGGLIVQRLLLTHRELATKVRFIYFLSTPEEGSQVARLGHVINGDPDLKQMFNGDSNTYLENIEAEWKGAKFDIPRYCTIERKKTKGLLIVDKLSGTRNCESVVALDEDHPGVAKPCSENDDSYIALRNAEKKNPVLHSETTTREWRSYQAVDCSRTNSGTLTASIALDPAFFEKVTGPPKTYYESSDHIKDATGPNVVSQQGNTAQISYGFNGEDQGFNCRGGHTTIVASFPIERHVPVQ